MASDVVRLHSHDNVAVVVRDGELIPRGHKVALEDIPAGAVVIKYGAPIGIAIRDIAVGDWVHSHNLRTNLQGKVTYQWTPPGDAPASTACARTFPGFRRANGAVGIRNDLWIIPTVGCVNGIARRLAAAASPRCAQGTIDGVYAFPHPYGCSQLGEDHRATQRILAGLAHHPNAGGVLVLGLGCENNHIAEFQTVLGDVDPHRVKFLQCQDVEDEMAAGLRLLEELAEYVGQAQREPVPISTLIIGLKCGGSDAFSGITANPLVGRVSDRLTACGGTTLLTEMPEMFGAEHLLLERCASRELFDKAVAMIDEFKDYYARHGQPIYENPSPGNKDGGITTLEEKSLGCTQKGGTRPVVDVLAYGERVTTPGLNLLAGPGNDIIAVTALAAAGAHPVLFTTGRGTPLGGPVPTVKIGSNSALVQRKPHWIDFAAGMLLDGVPLETLAEDLLNQMVAVAGGATTANERQGMREIAIFKGGVTL